jgi:hypothetical protein
MSGWGEYNNPNQNWGSNQSWGSNGSNGSNPNQNTQQPGFIQPDIKSGWGQS